VGTRTSGATQNRFDVAIIGGGASGLITAVQLLRIARKNPDSVLSVALIHETDILGRGPAYSTTCGEHLLNVPAKGMSAIAEDRSHFLRWLVRSGIDAVPETFAPRMMYGQYLEDTLNETQRGLSDNIRLSILREHAIDLKKLPGSGNSTASADWAIEFASGASITAGAVVVAVGNFAPEQHVVTSFMDLPCAGYHENPWSSGGMSQIKPNQDVLMIGTGLTMIDIVLQLRSDGHRGRLIGLSRHGLLPQVHFNDERMQDDQPTKYLPEELPVRLNELFHCVRQRIKAAEMRREGNWRFVINELRPHTSDIWRRLNLSDRKRFLRHVRQRWETHRHRMAPEIDTKVRALVRANRLSFTHGRIVDIEKANEQFVVSVKATGGKIEYHTVDHIVNCTGPQTDLRRVRHPLLVSMLSSGLLVADELGLSAKTDAPGVLIGRDETVPVSNLYALGAMRKGELWESLAIPEIREQAKELAQAVLQKLTDETRTGSTLVEAAVPG